MKTLVDVYRYECHIGNFQMTIVFLNDESMKREGADHSFDSLNRRNWAESLVTHYRELIHQNAEKVLFNNTAFFQKTDFLCFSLGTKFQIKVMHI